MKMILRKSSSKLPFHDSFLENCLRMVDILRSECLFMLYLFLYFVISRSPSHSPSHSLTPPLPHCFDSSFSPLYLVASVLPSPPLPRSRPPASLSPLWPFPWWIHSPEGTRHHGRQHREQRKLRSLWYWELLHCDVVDLPRWVPPE